MSRAHWYLCWLMILCSLAARWKFFQDLPPTWGYDSYSHLDYVALIHQDILPHPSQIWQGYQPPAYYFTSSQIAKAVKTNPFRTAQMVSLICSVLIAVPGYLLARRLVPGWEPLAILALLSLPVSLLTAPMVYNQQMATLWVGLFLVVLYQAWNGPPKLWKEVSLGLVWGLAVLTRFDGLMLAFPLALLWLRRLRSEPKQAVAASAAFCLSSLLAVTLFSGLILRNIADYSQPLITNRHPLLYPYPLEDTTSLPNFLHPRCLVDPGLALWQNPKAKNMESLPMFLFTNLWGGDQNTPVPGQLLMVSGISLMALMALGFQQKKMNREWQPVLAVALANLLFITLFYFQQPDFTNYKACYFHATFYFLALALAAGARELHSRGYGAASTIAWMLPQGILVSSFLAR